MKYYNTLFALKTQICLDNFATIITANVFGLMVREFVFVLIQMFVRKFLSMKICVM